VEIRVSASTTPPAASASSNHFEQLRDRAFLELATASDRIPFQRAQVLILVSVAFGTLPNAIEEYNVGLAAPLIASQWSLSNARVGLLTTLTFAGMAIGPASAVSVGSLVQVDHSLPASAISACHPPVSVSRDSRVRSGALHWSARCCTTRLWVP